MARFLVDPGSRLQKIETIVPHPLHIPLVLFELMRKEGCPLMPHKVLALVLKHIKDVPTEQEEATGNALQLVVRWCVIAA